jgi:hypothetical protein
MHIIKRYFVKQRLKKFYTFIKEKLNNILFVIFFLTILYILYDVFLKLHPELLTFEYWGDSDNINRAEIIRNIGLVFLGIFALIIAIWRALVATKELSNTKLKINQEKLHKAVELLETNSERNKISAFTILAELIKENNNFDEIIFQISKSYLQEFANVKLEFLKYKDNSPKEKIEKWYSRKTKNYSIALCFENYIKLINEKRIKYNLNQPLLFSNLDLHGLQIIKPNAFFQGCDLSNCTIYCDKNTKFSHCDLTGAIIIPHENNTLIFDWSNISYLRIQVPDNIKPILNGWHWEKQPPKICSLCTFLSLPEDRRVVVMSSNRIMDTCLMENFYNNEYRTEPPFGSFLFEDSLENDIEKQKIISELEYQASNNGIAKL